MIQTLLTSDDANQADINPALHASVCYIFEVMLLHFGKRFTDQWNAINPEEMRFHWCTNLIGYTPRELKRGVAELDNLVWPPSLPEFKKLCRPPVNFEKAYYEAVEGLISRDHGKMGVWSNPAIFWAYKRLYFDLKHKSFPEVKNQWERILKEELAKGSWERIPAPMIAISYKDEKTKIQDEKTRIAAEKSREFIKNFLKKEKEEAVQENL